MPSRSSRTRSPYSYECISHELDRGQAQSCSQTTTGKDIGHLTVSEEAASPLARNLDGSTADLSRTS